MSITFNGSSQYVYIASVPSQTDWSMSAWIRRNSDANTRRTFMSVDNENWTGQTSIYVRTNGDDGAERWRAGTGTSGLGAGSLFSPVVIGTWYYFEMRLEDGTVTFRWVVDGGTTWSTGTQAIGVSTLTPTHVNLGARGDGSEWFTGNIAMSKLWSGTLPTADQVLAERLNTDVINTTGLWAAYDFLDEALDTDRSGNSRTLTLVDTPTYTADKPNDLTIGLPEKGKAIISPTGNEMIFSSTGNPFIIR